MKAIGTPTTDQQLSFEPILPPSDFPSLKLVKKRTQRGIRLEVTGGRIRRSPKAGTEAWLTDKNFESFRVFPGVQRAFRTLSNLKGTVPPSPLFLLKGAHGTGKTHLIHATAQALAAQGYGRAVHLTDGPSLLSKFIAAGRRDEGALLFELGEAPDALLIDDLDALRGHGNFQYSLSFALDRLMVRGKIAVLALSSEQGDWDPRLRARLDRATILSLTAADEAPMDHKQLLRAVSKLYKVTLADLCSPSRRRELVEPRHSAMYVLYKKGGFSLERIGEIFDRDHSSVLHAVQRVEERRESDPRLKQALGLLC